MPMRLRRTRTRMNIRKLPSDCSFCPLVHLLFDRKKKPKLPAETREYSGGRVAMWPNGHAPKAHQNADEYRGFALGKRIK